jgi:hypothetical protein
MFTGSITRLSALAGPSFILDLTPYRRTTRFLQVDLLGGYLATRSQPDEAGPAAGIDITYQLWAMRAGVRAVQAFGDARDATAVVAHFGFIVGGGPVRDRGDCPQNAPDEPTSRLAIAMVFPLSGGGISSELGYLAGGFGLEASVYLSRSLDLVTRADLLMFPNEDRDRVAHQNLLAGLRIDHGKDTERSIRWGFFTTVMGGYSHVAGLAADRSGPIADLSFAINVQGRDAAAWFALHTRFGVPDNFDLRIFPSIGLQLRLDRRRWGRRV